MIHSKRSYKCWLRWVMMLVFLPAAAACLADHNGGAPTPSALPAALPTHTPNLPDLIIEAVSIQVVEPTGEDCSTPVALFHLHVTVANRGTAAAGAFTVRANTQTGQTRGGLQPGESAELTFPYETVRPNVVIDSAGQVAESDERNNSFNDLLNLPSLPQACLKTPTPVSVIQAPLAALEGHTAAVRAVSFSPDGKLVASGSVDNTMRLWTVAPPAALRVMQGHSFPILCLEFTPNGSQLVTGSMDGIIRAWQVANSALLSTMRGHAGWVRTLDISPDGLWLASGSDDFTIRIWRLPSSSLAETIDEGMTAIQQVAFAPDSKSYAWIEESGAVRLRRLNEDGTHSFQGGAGSAAGLAFLPDGQRLAAGYADGSIRIWTTSDGMLEQMIKNGGRAVTALAVSSDGRWLAAGREDGALTVWDIAALPQNSDPTVTLNGHTGTVHAIDFSPLGNLVISGGEGGELLLWSTP